MFIFDIRITRCSVRCICKSCFLTCKSWRWILVPFFLYFFSKLRFRATGFASLRKHFMTFIISISYQKWRSSWQERRGCTIFGACRNGNYLIMCISRHSSLCYGIVTLWKFIKVSSYCVAMTGTQFHNLAKINMSIV